MKRIEKIRKQEIMYHFHKIISQHGFSGASLSKVAKSMGTNASLLLHYYKCKEDMILDFTDFIIKKYEEYYIEQLKSLTDSEAKLHFLLDRLFEDSRKLNHYLVGDRAFYECYALSITHPEVKIKFRQFYNRFQRSLAAELIKLLKADKLEAKTSQLLSDFLIVMLEGKDFYTNLIEDETAFVRLRIFLKQVSFQVLSGLKKNSDGWGFEELNYQITTQ
jgi:AcrR family transcriptional regulator